MFTADVRVQVPPRPPKRDIRKDVSFVLYKWLRVVRSLYDWLNCDILVEKGGATMEFSDEIVNITINAREAIMFYPEISMIAMDVK